MVNTLSSSFELNSKRKLERMDANQFGSRLRELREAAGLTQDALAELTGLSQKGISQWERGQRKANYFEAVALAEALGVDCTAFQLPPSTAPEDEPEAPKRPRGR